MRADPGPLSLADLQKEALAEGSDLFKVLFEQAPDAYYLSDSKGRFIDGNKAAEAMIGYRKEDLIGKSFLKLGLIDREQVAKSLALLVKSALGKPTGPDEFTVIRKDGTEIVAEIRTYPLVFRGKTVVLGIARDITERLRAVARLEESQDRLRKSRDALVQALMMTIEMRDPSTAGHQKRVAELAVTIAEEMGLREDVVETIRIASLIHDIGKIAVPAEILNRPGRLDDEELEMIREHPRAGYEMLRQIDMMETIAEIVYQHHERMNGTGYPRGLSGLEILPETKIISVAEAVEAMSSHRPYRAALGVEKALREIARNKGILYDFDVAEACRRVFAGGKFEFGRGGIQASKANPPVRNSRTHAAAASES